MWAPLRNTGVGQEEKKTGKHELEYSQRFLWEGMGELELAHLGLAGLDDSSGLWGYKSCPQLSDTWPWGDYGKWIVVQKCESPRNEVVENAGSGFVGAHLKSLLLEEWFTRSGTG